MNDDGNIIADCVLDTFQGLPSKFKPRDKVDGTQEWVPLSGIVLSRNDRKRVGRRVYQCVALGTGMRCLPASKLPQAKGLCLHDWHAEIVAVRAFNLFLLNECDDLITKEAKCSKFVERRTRNEISHDDGPPIAVKDDVKIHMYCSHAPCGDVSMELTINEQDDASPWPAPSALGATHALAGRGEFGRLGIVRRKPSRADAPQTLSKSCSDKLAMKQCTSLLSSMTSLLICPKNVYLSEIVLPKDQHVESATKRAFSSSGRMSSLKNADGSLKSWSQGYSYKPFRIATTSRRFNYSRHSSLTGKAVGSNITAVWTPRRQEVLIGGTIQGNKQFSARGSSMISRGGLWRTALELAKSLSSPGLMSLLQLEQYSNIKQSQRLSTRRQVKDDVRSTALAGWIRNNGDDDFQLMT